MSPQETPKERKKRFKEMSSNDRKDLIRKKMKKEGLIEGSGVSGKDLSSYDRNEIWDLIQVTHCFSEIKKENGSIQSKRTNKKKSLFGWILCFLVTACGVGMYYTQYPYLEIRRELSVDGIFLD